MPPKKKGGKAKKKEDDNELSMDEQYKRAAQEVSGLKEQLVEKKENARRSQVSEGMMKERMIATQQVVEEERVSKKEISYDLTRQYKTMQTGLEGKIEALEAQVKRLQTNLEETKQELAQVTAEKERLEKEKEEEIVALNNKLHVMDKSYEGIIQDVLDVLSNKVEAARSQWDADSREMELSIQQVLLEFGKGLPHT